MPLQHSSSPSAFKANVKTLMGEVGKSKHVQSPQQALAISYDIKRRAKRERGGKVKGYDAGGAADAVNQVITALQSGSNQGTSAGSNPGMNNSAPTPASFAATPAATSSTLPPPNTGLGTSNPLANQIQPVGSASIAPPPVTAGLAPQQLPQRGLGGMKRGGVPHLAMGGIGQAPPWYVRNEAHSLNHSGPIMSAVPGRTDRHNLSVPGGSYIFPADMVSHLGQNNSQAGMKILSNMGFGSGGPFGGAGPKMARGMGLPKPPRPMGIPGDKGGARGDGTGTPVPIVVAGGEFAAPPEAIMKVLKTTDLKHAHKTLDAWVMQVRKDHIKTLRGLPPPAKS
jgi:hypothetical protein